jgi:hypothetical protein
MASVSDPDPQSRTTEPSSTQRRDRTARHEEPSAEKIADEAAAIYPDTFETSPTPDEIAAEAHAIYLARGGEHGRDQDDWFEAERRLTARRRQPPAKT